MATPQQVKRLALFAIVVGIAVMGLSSKVEPNSMIAVIITFVTGLGLADVGVYKLGQAAKASG